MNLSDLLKKNCPVQVELNKETGLTMAVFKEVLSIPGMLAMGP